MMPAPATHVPETIQPNSVGTNLKKSTVGKKVTVQRWGSNDQAIADKNRANIPLGPNMLYNQEHKAEIMKNSLRLQPEQSFPKSALNLRPGFNYDGQSHNEQQFGLITENQASNWPPPQLEAEKSKQKQNTRWPQPGS